MPTDRTGRRVAFFLPALTGGGAERVVLYLAGAAADRGLKVDLVVARVRGEYCGAVPPSVQTVDLGCRNFLHSLPRLVAYLRRARPESLLAALDHANLVAIWACALAGTGTRCCISVHSLITKTWSGGVIRRGIPRLAGWFYPRAQAIIAVSRGVAQDIAGLTGLHAGRITVINNPVVPPDLAEKAKQETGHPWLEPGRAPLILAAGRLIAAKDFGTLIRAFQIVRREIPARLMILGEGPERASLENLIRENGLGQDIRLPGFVANPFAFMSRCSVFVLSSVWEGFGNVLAEAMACGCPVISTDCPGGAAEILGGGKYGLLVRAGDPAGMAGAILQVLAEKPDTGVARARAADFAVGRISEDYLRLILAENERSVV